MQEEEKAEYHRRKEAERQQARFEAERKLRHKIQQENEQETLIAMKEEGKEEEQEEQRVESTAVYVTQPQIWVSQPSVQRPPRSLETMQITVLTQPFSSPIPSSPPPPPQPPKTISLLNSALQQNSSRDFVHTISSTSPTASSTTTDKPQTESNDRSLLPIAKGVSNTPNID